MGQDDTKEIAGTGAKEVRARTQTAIKAATKRRLCSTSYSQELQLEEYLYREESVTVEIAQLMKENLRSKRSLVGPNRVLSARRRVEALGVDFTTEEFIETVSNCNDTIRELSEEVDASTHREIRLGAIGSQQEVTNSFTIPRIQDTLPDTLTEKSPGKQMMFS